LQTFLQRYWFVIALTIGAIAWVWRVRRRLSASAHAPPRPRPRSGSVGTVLFRGADFAVRVATFERFVWKRIAGMIVFGLVSVGLFAAPGLPRATRILGGGAAAAGAVLCWLALAIGEGKLLRRLGLYCPQCGARLVEASEDRVPLQKVVRETGQCRCGAWLVDPADLPSGQGPDAQYLSPSQHHPD